MEERKERKVKSIAGMENVQPQWIIGYSIVVIVFAHSFVGREIDMIRILKSTRKVNHFCGNAFFCPLNWISSAEHCLGKVKYVPFDEIDPSSPYVMDV